MNNFADNHQKVPPSYEAAIGSNTNVGGPFPSFPQPSCNPAYIPQAVNPTLSNSSTMHPNSQAVIGVPVFGEYGYPMIFPNVMQARSTLIAFLIFVVLLVFTFVILCAVLLKRSDSNLASTNRMIFKH
ncbi:unnamed protein product [Cercopithifilaria johnstoni]|uniref:Uncharacterized protein n=1 Tax=Cercopithifilaria johnstoni TaxID=2874296 RepID=A0A8J2MHB6_9BILA|nr:unnamed protein product [Cercopithifilaria johnstoni]